MRPILSLCTLMLLIAPAARAWGDLGHRLVAATALQDLPPDVAAWFEGREATLPDHASDPDRWKGDDPGARPRHFLHCEAYGGAASVPVDEEAARNRLGAEDFQANGQVPWVILHQTDRLADAFRSGDPRQAALEAAWLSHYVGDLHVPLHTTLNHDGGRTGQHGVHHRWEAKLLERRVEGGWTPAVLPALPSASPLDAPFAWLQASNALVASVLAADAEAGRAQGQEPTFHGRAYWSVFMRLQGPQVERQLELAAQATAQKILDAWVQAGRPAASRMGRVRPSHGKDVSPESRNPEASCASFQPLCLAFPSWPRP
jgi:hypothetical protein